MLRLFAAEDGPHVVIRPDTLFEVAGFPITNSIIFGWLVAILLIVGLIYSAKKIKIGGTRGFAGAIEFGVDMIIGLLTTTIGSKSKAVKYAPLFATLFFFIMFNNWLGLLPGVGPAFGYNEAPLFRAFTADLNGTIALALFGMVTIQIIVIKEKGLKKYAKHYFPLSVYNPANYGIGLFEIFTEFTRLASLGLRLFLNVAIGEILISVASYLGGTFAAPVAALPFTLFELFVGALQAFIFVVLCAAYLSASLAGHGDEHEKAAKA